MTHRSRNGGPVKTHHRPKAKAAAASSKTTTTTTGTGTAMNEASPGSASQDTQPTPFPAIYASPTIPMILALVRQALSSTLSDPNFPQTVQKIKSLLYEKKWLEVFEDEVLLQAYAGRWVPGRVGAFRDLIVGSKEVRRILKLEDTLAVDGEGVAGPSRARVVSLGGGAGSELLAFAAIYQPHQKGKGKGKERESAPPVCEWTGVDIGPWAQVIQHFISAIKEDPEWSPAPGIEPDVNRLNTYSYLQANLLEQTGLQALIPILTDDKPSSSSSPGGQIEIGHGIGSTLVTLFFTLSELLAQSRTATVKLLLTLLTHLAPGSLFLVADSASDIGEFELGSSGRKWPVYMVLDAILGGMATPADTGGAEGVERAKRWEKVEGSDSRWYRLPEGVQTQSGWPVKLENTRYWYRLYRVK